MIITSNRIRVNLEFADAFEQSFKERASLVDDMPGFVGFQLLRPDNPEDPYIAMTFWESKAHFEAWTSSDAFRQGHARSSTLPPGTFPERPKLELHEIIQSTFTIQSTSEDV